MSRARNIKPGFFKNEDLAECDPLARILFAGLWCQSDREGRMEDRPKRIKAEVLPYDDCDIDELLGQLERFGFIVRYEVNGNRYLAIPEFTKHQNPHMREPASQIPAPFQHSASTVQAPGENSSGPADSPSLIPDSLQEQDNLRLSADSDGQTPPPACPHEAIVAAYHEILPELPRVRTWDSGRQAYLRSRWREDPERQTLDWWREFFKFVRRCPFLLGQQAVGDRDPFLADLEWLIRPQNFRKVIEGKYERRAA